MLKKTYVFFVIILIGALWATPVGAAAPGSPTNLDVQPQGLPSSNIILNWQAPAESVDYYNIYRHYYGPITAADAEQNIAFSSGGVTTYVDSDTIPGETYFYQVSAVNDSGEESAISTSIISDNATVPGKLKPHMGSDFSINGGVCRFCHKVHKAAAPKKILRKTKLIDTTDAIEVCYTCHDGTGSDFIIKEQFDLPTTAHNTELQGNISAGIKCLNCHHPHGKPPNPRMTHELEENLCFTCHRTNGQNGEGVSYPTAPKVKEAFDNDVNNNLSQGIVFAHPIRPTDPDPANNKHTNSYDENLDINSDGKAGDGYSLMTALTRHVECTDCHNQHKAARTGTTDLGPLEGASGTVVDNETGWAVGSAGTIIKTKNVENTWYSLVSDNAQTLNDTFIMKDNVTGWAVGTNGTILKTTNGGDTWNPQISGTTVSLNSVYFASSSVGWAVGANGTILWSTDGGSTWSPQTSGTTANLNSVFSSTNVWAVGANGTILRALNGGSTWVAQPSATTANLNNVYFHSSAYGWAVGANGTIVKTTNGNSTPTSWSTMTSGTSNNLNSIYLITTTKGFVVGANGLVLKTTNGSTWVSQPSGTTNDLNDIYSVGTNSGGSAWAVGNNGTIIKTTNGGTSWSSEASGVTDNLTSVSFTNYLPGYKYVINLITAQYQVCFKCHSSFNPSYSSVPFNINDRARSNKALEFNTYNSAYHPVEGPGRNLSKNLCNQLQAVFGLDCSGDGSAALSLGSVTIKCTNCHNNSDSSGAKGPHGSANQFIVKAKYNRDLSYPRSDYDANNFALCFSCHNPDVLLGWPFVWDATPGLGSTNFYAWWVSSNGSDHDDNLHWLHLARGDVNARCADCHYNIHSNVEAQNTIYRFDIFYNSEPPNAFPTRLINFAPHVRGLGFNAKPRWDYRESSRTRYCYLKCHRKDGSDADMNGYDYRPPSGDVP